MQDLENLLQSNAEKTIFVVSGENLLNALAIRWMNPVLSDEPGSDLPMLPMEKGDFFLIEVPRGHSIEQAEVKTLFHIGSFEELLPSGKEILRSGTVAATIENDGRPTPIKSVLFDFGGVLVKPDEDTLIAYLADFFDVCQNQIKELQVEELEWIRVNDAEFSFWQNYGKQIGKELPFIPLVIEETV